MSTCSGDCCRSFTIGHSPEQIEAWGPKVEDGEQIADMLIPLGPFQPGEALPNGRLAEDGSHYYTCRHFDDAAKTCTDYDNRPRMCRDYPYRGVCEHEACGWPAAKDKAHPGRLVVRYGGVTHLRMAPREPPSYDAPVCDEAEVVSPSAQDITAGQPRPSHADRGTVEQESRTE